MKNHKYMEIAISEAGKNLRKCEGGPFGACIVRNGKIISKAHNTVLGKKDSTCHAEVNAIRKACKKLKNWDLSGCEIYSTTEPCPMCFSAIHWARIGTIVYGAETKDAKKAGFNELCISCRELKKIGKSRIKLVGGIGKEECMKLFEEWVKKGCGNY